MATVYHCYTSYGTAPSALPPFDDDGGYHFAFYCSFQRTFPGNHYPDHLRSPEPPILCVIVLPCHSLFHSAGAAAAVQQLISEMGVRLPPEFVRSLGQTVSSMAARAAAFPNLAASRILPLHLQIVAESPPPYSDVALTYPLTRRTRCGRGFDDVDVGDDDDHHPSSSVGSDLDHDHFYDDDDDDDNDEALRSVSSSTSSELVSCNDEQTGQNKSTVTATSRTSTESKPNSDESESESEEGGEQEEDESTVDFDQEADPDWIRRLVEAHFSKDRSINVNEDSDHDHDHDDDHHHHPSSSGGSDLDHDHVYDDDDFDDNDEALRSVSSSTSSELVSCNDDQTGQNKSTVTATSGTSKSIPNSDESESESKSKSKSESESEEGGEQGEDEPTVDSDLEADPDWIQRLIEAHFSNDRSINVNEDSDHDHDHDDDEDDDDDEEEEGVDDDDDDDDEGVDDDVFEDDWDTDDDELRTVPASQSAIRALEEVDTMTLVAVDNQCMVCLDDFSVPRGHTDGEDVSNDHRVVRMPCSHVYHRDCIVTWLENSHLCPICRFAMPTSASN